MILNNHLNNLAQAMNGDAYNYPSYGAVSTSAISVVATDTSMTGEIDSRFLMPGSVSNNQISYSGIRSGTEVTVYGGDTLKGFGAFSASSSGTMHAEITLPSITQTTNFDIEFNLTVNYTRQ